MALTQTQLACLFQARRDVFNQYVGQGWPADPARMGDIYGAWFNMIHETGARGASVSRNDAAFNYTDLGQYADSLGCGQTVPVTVPPNTSPGSGSIQPGLPQTTGPRAASPWEQANKFAKDHPEVVLGAVALLLLMFYKPGDVTFGR